jgi:steroid delta-isomerase-like uncharacterized protein
MIEDANTKIVLEYVDAFNRADLAALENLFGPDALVYGVLGWGVVEEVAPIWRELQTAFAIKLEVVSMISDGDTVAVRYRERGTSVGPFRGMEPTGKSFEVVSMEWFEFKDGKIHRRWGARDTAAQFRQRGCR